VNQDAQTQINQAALFERAEGSGAELLFIDSNN
jgi:hypothetical protein